MMLDNGSISKILLLLVTGLLLLFQPPMCRGVEPVGLPDGEDETKAAPKNTSHGLRMLSEHEIESRDGIARLLSPGFPHCCNSIHTATYVVTYTGEQNIYGIVLLFDDIDLPPDSTIQVHNLNNTVHASPLPRYTREGWTRPFIVLQATTLVLIVKFGVKGDRVYVGFKADCWAEVREPTYDIPYTDCPAAVDPMDGGEVKLSTTYLEHKGMGVHYRYNCVWQLKPPPASLDLIVYLRIQGMDLTEGGSAIIRRGTNSRTGVQIVQYGEEILRSDTDNLQQPDEGFVSIYGFYIHVMKEVDRGYFHFSYGVYADVGLAIGDNPECHYGSKGHLMRGYHCQRGSTWCIPEEHKCNGLKNCPFGDDEDEQLCSMKEHSKPRPSSGVLRDMSLKPDASGCAEICEERGCFYYCPEGCPPHLKKCGEKCVKSWSDCYEGCIDGMKKCGDRCINAWADCPLDCQPEEKRCKNGTCISIHILCPEEPCPVYRSGRCATGGTCYYESDHCDGKRDCLDGSDETDCYEVCQRAQSEMCADGRGCYDSSERCNDNWECLDGSDEQDCGEDVEMDMWKRSIHGYITIMILILLAILSIFLISKYRRFRAAAARQNGPVDQESTAAATYPAGSTAGANTRHSDSMNTRNSNPLPNSHQATGAQSPSTPTFISVPPPTYSGPQPELPPPYDEAVRLLSPPAPTEDPPSYSEVDPALSQRVHV